MKILYVDDAPFTRMLLKRCLEGAGHETQGAADGAEALACLEKEPFDLLLTDLLMDGVSGLELLSEVQARYPALPVVVVTADVQEATQSRCRELGAAAICPKGSLYPNGQGLLTIIAGLRKGEEA